MSKQDLIYLASHIVKTINLPDFVEEEAGCTIHWNRQDLSCKCCCPLHEEDVPSFNIDLKDDVWLFYCFGCGAKGNIIHFCQQFHGLRNKLEAINYLCKKYNIESGSDLVLEGIKQVGVKIDQQRLLENANILSSNQCRMLLRKNYEKNKKWVSSAYKKLNKALDEHDEKTIEYIGHEASKRMNTVKNKE